jgi:hypothetical protein
MKEIKQHFIQGQFYIVAAPSLGIHRAERISTYLQCLVIFRSF